MGSTPRRYMVTGLAAIGLGMTTLTSTTVAETALSEHSVRSLLNTAVVYHYHADVRRKTTEGACYFDPDKPTTIACLLRLSSPGEDAFRLRQKVKQYAVKGCKHVGGTSCVELFRNGELTYDGLSPGETQRLEAVLKSIPSYDPEATPLPDDATVRAGLFHERFAQMQTYWEDWRKRKKGRRDYAMCANAQGSGMRFQMQGEVKQLPHVRKMCILQCQAVAQWENTQGACHTIFENGEFTSAAAHRAMTLEVEPVSPEMRQAFVGTWSGTNHRGTIEIVVERVDADGGAAGTGCSALPNGSLAWRTLDNGTLENGDRISFMVGRFRNTLMMSATHEGAMEVVQTSPSGWQSRLPMKPMKTRGCNERFTASPIAGRTVERRPDDAPIVGAWSGKRRGKTGSVSELSIEAFADDGPLTGRYCTRTTRGELKVWDIGSDGPFQATVGKQGKKALMTVTWADGERDEYEFRVEMNDKMTLKLTQQAGTRNQKAYTLKMTRGASDDGCLLRTRSLSAANES